VTAAAWLLAAALQDVALSELLKSAPGAGGLFPFPRGLRIAVCPVGATPRPSDALLAEVSEFYRRASQGRLRLFFSRGPSLTAAGDLTRIRTGSEEEGRLVLPWLRDASSAAEPPDAYCFLVPRRGAARDWFTWPHEGSVLMGARRLRYYVAWGDSGEGETVGVHAHEIGHLADLEDEYEHQEAEEGAWCVMSRGYEGGRPPGRRPAPPCAPCRLKAGWIPSVELSPEQPLRVAFGGADACLRLPEQAVVEERDGRFLVWQKGRLAGTAEAERPVTIRGMEVRFGAPGVVELLPRAGRVRYLGEK
jgi:hypothetical protein